MIVLSWFRYLVPFLNTCLSGSIYVLSQPVLSQPYLAMVKAPKTKQRALEQASVCLQPLPFTRRVTLASGAVIVRPPAAAGSLYVHRCGFCTDAFKASSGLAQHIFHKHQNFTTQEFKNDLTAEGDEEQLYFGVPATPIGVPASPIVVHHSGSSSDDLPFIWQQLPSVAANIVCLAVNFPVEWNASGIPAYAVPAVVAPLEPPKKRKRHEKLPNGCTKQTRGADKRFHWSLAQKCDVLDKLTQLTDKKPEERHLAVSKMCGVPLANTYKWKKQAAKIYQMHGICKAVELMGPRANKIMSCKTTSRCVFTPKNYSAVEAAANEILKRRLQLRKPLTLKIFHRELKKEVQRLEELGVSLTRRGRKMTFSLTWSWRFLCMKGFVSRRRQCKRPIPPAVLAAMMKRWLHAVRSEMLTAIPLDQHPDFADLGEVNETYEVPKKKV